MMDGVKIAEALVPSPGGGFSMAKPSVYVAIPSGFERSTPILASQNQVYLGGAYESSRLIIKALYSTQLDELESQVKGFFKEDDPNKLQNWLV